MKDNEGIKNLLRYMKILVHALRDYMCELRRRNANVRTLGNAGNIFKTGRITGPSKDTSILITDKSLYAMFIEDKQTFNRDEGHLLFGRSTTRRLLK